MEAGKRATGPRLGVRLRAFLIAVALGIGGIGGFGGFAESFRARAI